MENNDAAAAVAASFCQAAADLRWQGLLAPPRRAGGPPIRSAFLATPPA